MLKTIQWKAIYAVFACLLSLEGAASAAITGVAKDYNAFVFGNFTSMYTDIEGRLAAGGNVFLTGVSVGSHLSTSGGATLVAGRNLNFSNGTIRKGGVIVGGSATVPAWAVPNGTVQQNTQGLSDFFAAAKVGYLQLSTFYNTLAVNGTVQRPYANQLRLTSSASQALSVFNLSASDFNNLNTFNLNFDASRAGATVIVNVSGTNVVIPNSTSYNVNGASLSNNGSRVLFNFFEATSLSIQGGTTFSVLAPQADVTAGWNQFNGQLVANSYCGNIGFHNHPFLGEAPPMPINNPVAEPSTYALLGGGLLSMVVLHRARRRQ